MQDGETALMYASRAGDLPVVQFLVERGAKLEAANKVCFTSTHPLSSVTSAVASAFICLAVQDRDEQSRAEQSRAEQGRAGQSRAGQDRGRAGQDMAHSMVTVRRPRQIAWVSKKSFTLLG